MITFTRVVHMITALAFTFLSTAGLYVLLSAEFVAFVQVLIYAGAVTILMIFGIMLTKREEQEKESVRPLHHLGLIAGIILLFVVIFFSIQPAAFPSAGEWTIADNTKAIGEQLFTWRVLPFELMSVLLTVAFIGAIMIAKKEGE